MPLNPEHSDAAAPSDAPAVDEAAQGPAAPLPPWWRDFLSFLWTEKRWWLVPLLLLLAVLIVLAVLTRQPERPPTYPSFHNAHARPPQPACRVSTASRRC